jgi:hypothetical protein
MGAPGTVGAVPNEAVVSAYFLSHEKRDKDVLGIDIEGKIVNRAD